MASATSGIKCNGIGSLIKHFRSQRRVTQRDLAAAATISIGALRDLEQGRTRFPRWGTVEELAVVLGLSQAERAELGRAWQAEEQAPVPGPRHGEPVRVVSIEVLGPLEVWRDGSRVALGSPRQRAVLGALALYAGTGLHRDAIIDLVWGEKSPVSAVPEVQGYVSRLRRILGDGPVRPENAEHITTLGGCYYRLNADVGQLRIDLADFWRLTGEARAARTDPAAACGRYERALELCRGDVLADIHLFRAHPAAIEVARQRADAVLGFARAAAECGSQPRALPQLRWLCAAEPLNEEAHAWLMVTLAAIGQQAAALRVFTEVRHRLRDELGITPSPVLARAHAQVLSGLA